MRRIISGFTVLAISILAASPVRSWGYELTLALRTWTAQAYAAYAGANNEALISANAGVGYHVIDNLSLNIEAACYGVLQDGGEDTGADRRAFRMRIQRLERPETDVRAGI